MKKILLGFAVSIVAIASHGQGLKDRSASITFNPNSGYINITELQPAIGLGETNRPYARFIFGITNISGYQITFKNSMVSKKLQGGIGTGVYVYNEGTLLPLFLDFRFIWNENKVTPYVFASGGGLIHFNDFDGQSRIFINPGVGARYTLSESLAVHAGTGFFVQSGPPGRDTFLSFKVGLSFKP